MRASPAASNCSCLLISPQQTNYVSSVEIRPEWAVVEQIPFASLAKLSCTVGDAEDVAKCGELEYYDKVRQAEFGLWWKRAACCPYPFLKYCLSSHNSHNSQAYDRITIKSETPLEKTRRAFRNVTTSEDPVIRCGGVWEGLFLFV